MAPFFVFSEKKKLKKKLKKLHHFVVLGFFFAVAASLPNDFFIWTVQIQEVCVID